MKWSFRIATVKGTEVRVHVTFFLLLFWVAAAYLAEGSAAKAIGAITFFCALFACVVLHELGHAMAARRFGIHTPDITLLPIGGLARLERIPESPRQELIIALAGPMVNVIIAAALYVILGGFPELNIGFDIAEPGAILPNLLLVNLWLVIFNMIPAFPMDGGRVLRATLALFIERDRATAVATSIGQYLAVLGGIIGLLMSHPFLILIAIFVFMSAGAEAALVRTRTALQDVPVSAAMIKSFRTLPHTAKLGDAVRALLDGAQEDFPIIDDTDRVIGLLTRSQLVTALASHDENHSIAHTDLSPPAGTRPDAPLADAIELFQAGISSTIPVFERDGTELIGLLTMSNVSELLLVKSALDKSQNKSPLTPIEPSKAEAR